MASEETAAERWAAWHAGQGGEANKSAENKDWDARKHREKASAISATAASTGEHQPAAQAHGVAAEKFDAASKAYAAAGNDHRAARAGRDRDEHLKMKAAHEAHNASKVADKANTPEAHTAAAAAHDVAARHAGMPLRGVQMHRSEQARHKKAAAAGQGRRANPYPKNTSAGVAKVSEAIEKSGGGKIGAWAAKKAGK